MAKNKKITATMVAKAMGLTAPKGISIKLGDGENAIEIPVKNRLSLSERAMMIADIINMVFIETESGTRFCPSFQDFAIDFNIVTYFTEVVLSSDSDKAYRFLEESELADKIAQALPFNYVANIIYEAKEAIEFHKQALLKKSKLEDVLDKVLGVMNSLNEKTENVEMPQIMEYIEKNIPEFKGQVEQLIKSQAAKPTA